MHPSIVGAPVPQQVVAASGDVVEPVVVSPPSTTAVVTRNDPHVFAALPMVLVLSVAGNRPVVPNRTAPPDWYSAVTVPPGRITCTYPSARTLRNPDPVPTQVASVVESPTHQVSVAACDPSRVAMSPVAPSAIVTDPVPSPCAEHVSSSALSAASSYDIRQSP